VRSWGNACFAASQRCINDGELWGKVGQPALEKTVGPALLLSTSGRRRPCRIAGP